MIFIILSSFPSQHKSTLKSQQGAGAEPCFMSGQGQHRAGLWPAACRCQPLGKHQPHAQGWGQGGARMTEAPRPPAHRGWAGPGQHLFHSPELSLCPTSCWPQQIRSNTPPSKTTKISMYRCIVPYQYKNIQCINSTDPSSVDQTTAINHSAWDSIRPRERWGPQQHPNTGQGKVWLLAASQGHFLSR